MATVRESMTTAATPQQVWAVLVDPSRYGEWLELHDGFVGEPPAAFAAGTSFGQRVTVLGMPADVRWTVAELHEPTEVALTGTGPMGIALRADYTVAQDGSGAGPDGATRVTVAMDFSGPAVAMMGSRIEDELGGRLRGSLVKLKAVTEAA